MHAQSPLLAKPPAPAASPASVARNGAPSPGFTTALAAALQPAPSSPETGSKASAQPESPVAPAPPDDAGPAAPPVPQAILAPSSAPTRSSTSKPGASSTDAADDDPDASPVLVSANGIATAPASPVATPPPPSSASGSTADPSEGEAPELPRGTPPRVRADSTASPDRTAEAMESLASSSGQSARHEPAPSGAQPALPQLPTDPKADVAAVANVGLHPAPAAATSAPASTDPATGASMIDDGRGASASPNPAKAATGASTLPASRRAELLAQHDNSPGPPTAPPDATTSKTLAHGPVLPDTAPLAPAASPGAAVPQPAAAPAAPAPPPGPAPAPPAIPLPAPAQLAPVFATLAPAAQPGAPQQLVIRLDPAELGHVQVQIDRSAEGPAHVVLAVERADTLMLLMQDRPQLNHALDAAGVAPEGRTLQFSLSSGGGQSAGQSFSGQTPGGGGQGGRREAPARPPSHTAWLRSGIDITA